ncbi:MAG: carboxypeptidase M32 [Chloroflexota bacterium]
MTQSGYDALMAHIAELSDILNAISVLKWDARTQMPPGGAVTRGNQLATLSKLAQSHFTSDTTLHLIEAAETEVVNESGDSYRFRAVLQTRHAYELMRRISAELIGRKAALAPVSEQVWAQAKANNDFASFKPYLLQMVDLVRQQAEEVGYIDHPFDALVREYEPMVNTAKLKLIFEQLRAGLIPLLQAIVAHPRPLERDLWASEYPVAQQKAFALETAQRFGYDMQRGRLDIAPHPFEISFTRNDVRITTRYHKTFFPMAFFGTLHETGHGLYEQGVDPALTRSPLTTDFLGQYAVGGASYGTHESQSRLWENVVGRSRAFWNANFSRMQHYFPEQTAGADADLIYRAVNRVEPSLIRVEADEVTYNLHIMLRTEIEMGLLDGSMKVDDLPDIWNETMQAYLGVVPPDDRRGVLQDVHWSGGGFGSFPSYTIGNIMSAQFFEAARRDIPTLDQSLEGGDYAPLLGWLQQNIYRHGRAFNGEELLQRSTGEGLSVTPYLRYLQAKFADLYHLP